MIEHKPKPKALNFTLFEGLDDNLRQILHEKYHIESLDIEDVFTDTQLSKVEQRENYLYVALEFPFFDRSKRQFIPKEVHCFIDTQHILVIDKHDYSYIQNFDNLKEGLIKTNHSSFNLFYEMLDFTITKMFNVIGKFKQEITVVEQQIFDFNHEEDLVSEILIIKRNLINFISLITPLGKVINEIQHKYNRFIDKDGQEKLDDSLDKIEKMLNNLQNFKEQTDLLLQANEGQLVRSTNQVIKALTAFSVLILVPSIIVGFFGMNIHFGWDAANSDFRPIIAIIVIMLSAMSLMYGYFKIKKWI